MGPWYDLLCHAAALGGALPWAVLGTRDREAGHVNCNAVSCSPAASSSCTPESDPLERSCDTGQPARSRASRVWMITLCMGSRVTTHLVEDALRLHATCVGCTGHMRHRAESEHRRYNRFHRGSNGGLTTASVAPCKVEPSSASSFLVQSLRCVSRISCIWVASLHLAPLRI